MFHGRVRPPVAQDESAEGEGRVSFPCGRVFRLLDDPVFREDLLLAGRVGEKGPDDLFEVDVDLVRLGLPLEAGRGDGGKKRVSHERGSFQSGVAEMSEANQGICHNLHKKSIIRSVLSIKIPLLSAKTAV